MLDRFGLSSVDLRSNACARDLMRSRDVEVKDAHCAVRCLNAAKWVPHNRFIQIKHALDHIILYSLERSPISLVTHSLHATTHRVREVVLTLPRSHDHAEEVSTFVTLYRGKDASE